MAAKVTKKQCKANTNRNELLTYVVDYVLHLKLFIKTSNCL